MTAAVAAILGLGTGLGLLLICVGWTARQKHALDLDTPQDEASAIEATRTPSLATILVESGPATWRTLACCGVLGALAALATGWPVAALLTVAGAWVLPRLVGPDREHRQRVARVEAIATWTETLRDSLAGASGLEQAISASAVEAPEPIREEITRLATRLRRGWAPRNALRALASELADPAADLVVAGLLMAARGSAGQLGEVLGELALSARKDVAVRQRVAASRASNQASTRVVVGATLTMAVLLVTLNREYLEPFDSAIGQLVLLACGGCFAAAFAWLARLTREREGTRILASVADPTSPGTEAGETS